MKDLDNKKNKKDTIRKQIFGLTREYYRISESIIDPDNDNLSLMSAPYGVEEVNQAIDSLLSSYLTLNQFKNNKINRFEQIWSEYISVTNSILVNSGSSANFLALQVLSNPSLEDYIKPGDEIITPAVTWGTTVFPIINIGAIPVLIDVDLKSMTIDTKQIENAITNKTKAIMPVHLLGNACKMDEIQAICKKRNLFLIEDCCEAHGAEFNGKRVGGFGDFSTFSFFFSHHITTIEGGALCTSKEKLADLSIILRSQGVVRNIKNKDRVLNNIKNNPKYKDIDENYLFVNIGFNLRPTEITGGFGLEQMKKIDGFISKRIENAEYLIPKLKRFSKYLITPEFLEGQKQTWFAFPFIVNPESGISRDDLTNYLGANGVEHRPIMSGNISRHPVMELYTHKISGPLNIANLIHSNGFLVGNNENVTFKMLDHLLSIFDKYFN